jgi:hypothetical protein
MTKYGQPKNYSRKQPQQQPAREAAPANNPQEFDSPDETIFPRLNMQVKDDKDYNYVATVYPYFKAKDKVAYRTSKKSESFIIIDDAKVIKEKQADGSFKTIGVVTNLTNVHGKEMWVPDSTSPNPFFLSPCKPKE